MSRFEANFAAAANAELSIEEQLGLAQAPGSAVPTREEAIACCLSAGEGWRDAIRALGGAFAKDAAQAARLSGEKAE